MVLIAACVLFVAILVMLEIGRRIGIRRQAKAPPAQGEKPGTGVLDAAVFGLMGLLLAFTFSVAAARWEVRRNQIVDEANAIGTAYLRLDLLPPDTQPELKENFRRYLRSRLAIYRKIPDWDAVMSELKHSEALQLEIWRQAIAASREAGSPAVMTLVLSEINEMIDMTTVRSAAVLAHLPTVVFYMLVLTILFCSLVAGHNMAANGTRNWLNAIGYALLVSTVVYLILELEYPRLGLVRIDAADEVLEKTLQEMN